MPHETKPTAPAPTVATPAGSSRASRAAAGRRPTFTSAQVMVFGAATMVAISAIYGLLPQV